MEISQLNFKIPSKSIRKSCGINEVAERYTGYKWVKTPNKRDKKYRKRWRRADEKIATLL